MTRSFFAGQSGQAQQQPPQDRFSITLLDLAVLVPIRYTTFVRQMYIRCCGQKNIQYVDSQITARKQQIRSIRATASFLDRSCHRHWQALVLLGQQLLTIKCDGRTTQ
jgi:hypothetical protein